MMWRPNGGPWDSGGGGGGGGECLYLDIDENWGFAYKGGGLKAKDIWRGRQPRARIGFGKATSSGKTGGQGWVRAGL
jgi:hypothetical protein